MDEFWDREIQRRNGKLIIQAMMELERPTIDGIVERLCRNHDVSLPIQLRSFLGPFLWPQIFQLAADVRKAVAKLLKKAYFLGWIDLHCDGYIEVAR